MVRDLIEIHLNLHLWSPLPSTSLETKVPNHPTLESYKFKVLKECDFRHLETELVCYNASLYHVRMLLFSIEEKNSLATLKWSPITFPCNSKSYRQLCRQIHYHLLYLFCHACHASSVTTQFSIVARYHGIDFPCDLGIVIVLSCSLVKTLSRFTAKIYFE